VIALSEKFMEMSPADFFYRNRDLAGFNNPSRAIYAALRELVENSLDACELYEILPHLFLRVSKEKNGSGGDEASASYRVRIMDNGSGIPPEFVPSAFGQILFGSKYTLRQVRGTFGLGGKMAILYGQITTHGTATIMTSTGVAALKDMSLGFDLDQDRKMLVVRINTDITDHRGVDKETLQKDVVINDCKVQVNEKTIFIKPENEADLRKIRDSLGEIPVTVGINEFEISIDIQQNKPRVRRDIVKPNPNRWRGTIVEFSLEGDYFKAMPKILEYLRQTAMLNPYAEITFIDPRGRLYRFERATKTMPSPPKETLPHPYGCDVETLQRMITSTTCTSLVTFMSAHFHRVGEKTAKAFLLETGLIKLKSSGNPGGKEQVIGDKSPKRLTAEEIVRIVQTMRSFKSFLPPDSSCLSPLGEELLRAGIKKELSPEFLVVEQRGASAYSGYPFIIEVAIAYGGGVPNSADIGLYRFANRIPLLYDEASDISRIVMNEQVNWRNYKIATDMPVAVVVHICSTKIPYKTVGKEFIADRPEVAREIKNGISSVARRLAVFLTKKISVEHEKRRVDVFARYLPKIAQFSAELAGEPKKTDPEYVEMVKPLLRSLIRFGSEA
jgi:DNA topoisomerase-6 subunit B